MRLKSVLLALIGIISIYDISRMASASGPVFRNDFPINGSTPSRHWSDFKLNRVSTLSKTEVGDSNSIQADENGTVYVLDGVNKFVRAFYFDGKLTKDIGVGMPDHPLSFALGQHEDMWISDATTVWRYSLNTGEPVSKFKTKTRPFKITTVNDGVLVLTDPARFYFELYSSDGHLKQTFGQFLEGQDLRILDGVVTDTGDGFVYASANLGFMVNYDENGKLRYARRTATPVIVRSSTAQSVQVLGKYIFMSNGATVDVYAQSTGAYKYSFHLPADSVGLAFSPERIFTLSSRGSLSSWKA